jgi:hypothetical protein
MASAGHFSQRNDHIFILFILDNPKSYGYVSTHVNGMWIVERMHRVRK